jgi:hypothetical protein
LASSPRGLSRLPIIVSRQSQPVGV